MTMGSQKLLWKRIQLNQVQKMLIYKENKVSKMIQENYKMKKQKN